MSAGAPSTRRRALLRYAIGLDLVVVATGAALLFPDKQLFVIGAFAAAIALAAAMSEWRGGLAATAGSLVATALIFHVGVTGLAVLAMTGAAASAIFGRRDLAVLERPIAAHLPRPGRIVALLMYAGLPVLVLVVYTNISDILIRNFGVPSILQPIIVVTAIPIIIYRSKFRPADIAFQPLTLLLAAYCAVVFASGNWASETYYTDERLEDLLKSLVILVITGSLAASWRALRIALAALAGAAAVLSVLTIIQAVAGDPSLDFGGLATAQEGHIFGDVFEMRAAGPVGDPNVFGQILIITLPIAAFLSITARNRDYRMAYLAAAGAITAGVLLTYSRGVMLALAVVALLIVVAMRERLTVGKTLIIVALAAAILPTNFGKRFLTIAEVVTADEEVLTIDPSSEERRLFAVVAMRMFSDNPILGVGAGNYTKHYWRYANEIGSAAHRYDPIGKREQPHSLYLEIASETGLVGIIAFGGAMLVAFVALYHSRSDLLRRGERAYAAIVMGIAVALAGYLVSALFLHAGQQRYLWLILGFAVAAVRLTFVPPSPADDAEPVRG